MSFKSLYDHSRIFEEMQYSVSKIMWYLKLCGNPNGSILSKMMPMYYFIS